MNQKRIVISKSDHRKLSLLLQSEFTQAIGNNPYISRLRGELYNADIVEPDFIPPDIVTINSQVKLIDQDLNEDEIYTVVYPDEANINDGKLSILTPIGTAIFGCRIGDKVSGYASQMLIKEIIYQPQRSGIMSS